LKKAGENFTLGWALPNPPGALPLDPEEGLLYGYIGVIFTGFIKWFLNNQDTKRIKRLKQQFSYSDF